MILCLGRGRWRVLSPELPPNPRQARRLQIQPARNAPLREDAYPATVPELLAAVCFGVGGWWLFRSVRTLARGVLSRSWPTTRGVIVASKVVKKFNSHADEVWREELEYSYSVAGTRYRGTRRRFGVPAAFDWNDGLAQPLRPGDDVDVVYGRSRPSVSALRRGFSPFAVLPLVAGAMLIWIGVRLLAF